MYARLHNLVAVFAVLAAVMLVVLFSAIAVEYRQKGALPPSAELTGWKTNTSKTLVSLEEFSAEGPGRNCIPAINSPQFEMPFIAHQWLADREPVISVTVGEVSNALVDVFGRYRAGD